MSDRVFTCPNCGRYIGPVVKCPYCGEKVKRTGPIIMLKYGALVMAIVLTIGFWGAMAYSSLPEMHIKDITKSMNYSRIIITGTVPDTPKFYPSEYTGIGTMYFDIDDGTGTITVVAYDTATKEMIDTGNIPSIGDTVRVSGTVHWRGSDLKLILSSARQLEIERPAAVRTDISGITSHKSNFNEGDAVQIDGNVTSQIRDLGFAYKFTVEMNGSSISVMVYNSTIQLMGNSVKNGTMNDIRPGTRISVFGILDYYYGWSIIVPRPTDITILEGST